jgi:hypothetical protein
VYLRAIEPWPQPFFSTDRILFLCHIVSLQPALECVSKQRPYPKINRMASSIPAGQVPRRASRIFAPEELDDLARGFNPISANLLPAKIEDEVEFEDDYD